MIPRYGFIVNSYISAPKASKSFHTHSHTHSTHAEDMHRALPLRFIAGLQIRFSNLSMQIQLCAHTTTEAALSITFSQKNHKHYGIFADNCVQ